MLIGFDRRGSGREIRAGGCGLGSRRVVCGGNSDVEFNRGTVNSNDLEFARAARVSLEAVVFLKEAANLAVAR
jgi:hypothetical protein